MCLKLYCILAVVISTHCTLAKVTQDNDVNGAFNVEQFDEIMATYMRERQIPGASVAVSKNGQFLIRKGYGRASVERMMTPWALMRIGSVSKIITAVGVLKLVDEGLLKLDAKVFGTAGQLPEYAPEHGDSRILDITVRDLLQHSSGWDYRITGDPLFMPELHRHQQQQQPQRHLGAASNDNHLDETPMSVKESIVLYMMNQSLQYKPGTRYSYSNFGYTVLGLIIERVTGQRYELFTRNWLRRLGIVRMRLATNRKADADISEVDYFYRHDQTGNYISETDRTAAPRDDEQFNMAAVDSSSGWTSSATDVVRLIESIASAVSGSPSTIVATSPPVLRSSLVRTMLSRPSYDVDGTSTVWYGLGVVVEDTGRTFWHTGTLPGSTSVAAHDGRSGLTWAALLNCRLEPNSDLGDFMRYAIRQVFAGGRFTPAPTTPFPAEAPSESASVVGPSTTPVGSSWLQQQDSGDDGNREDGPEMIERSNEVEAVADTDSATWTTASRMVDSVSKDGRTAVKLMVPDYQIQKLVVAMDAIKYRPTWLDAFDYRGRVFFNVIWTKNDDDVRWRAYFDLTPSRYRKRFRARVVQRYRLAHVTTYVCRRRMRYAAVFVRGKGPDWTAYDGVSAQRHRSEFYRHLRDGYRLIVQSVTEYQGQLQVAAIYDKTPLGDGRVRLGLTTAEFGAELERQLSAGRVLAYVDAYEQRGSTRFSAVWTPRTSRHWAASHALSKYTLLNKLIDYAAVNVPLACVTAYVEDGASGGGLYFAALWR